MINRNNSSAIENYRKHLKVSRYLGKTGEVVQFTKISNPNDSLYYSGVVAIVKLDDGSQISVPIHTNCVDTVNEKTRVKLSLRLESKNQDGLRNYGLVAKILN